VVALTRRQESFRELALAQTLELFFRSYGNLCPYLFIFSEFFPGAVSDGEGVGLELRPGIGLGLAVDHKAGRGGSGPDRMGCPMRAACRREDVWWRNVDKPEEVHDKEEIDSSRVGSAVKRKLVAHNYGRERTIAPDKSDVWHVQPPRLSEVIAIEKEIRTYFRMG
jgi:hypothetical protein